MRIDVRVMPLVSRIGPSPRVVPHSGAWALHSALRAPCAQLRADTVYARAVQAIRDGAAVLEVNEVLRDVGTASPGVYAIYNEDRALQYVAYSMDLAADIQAHQERLGQALVAFARVKVFANAVMATPENMLREAQHWIEEAGGTLPPGNGVEADTWALLEPAGATSSEDEGPSGAVVSPFTQATVHRSVGQEAANAEMTLESVDHVLNDIRGYLFADGGDVTVTRVEGGLVHVRFEGNCATCTSQETTMKMGVERALKGAFPDAFRGVVAEDAPTASALTGATAEGIEQLLSLLRPAIQNYGGEVEVVSLQDGAVTVRYVGPDPIWVGVRNAIRDKFPDVTEVRRWEDAA